MYCRLQLRCDILGEQWEQAMCCHVSQFLIINNILLLFGNKLRCLIFMFGWFILWHVVQYKFSMWHID
jgi:hypothetical protein